MNVLIRIVNFFAFLLFLYLPYDYYHAQEVWDETVYKPKLMEIEAKINDLRIKTAQVKRAEEFRAQRDAKSEALRQLRLALDEQAKLVPKTANIKEVLKALADRADTTGLEFSSFKPESERRQRFLVLTPVKVKLAGTYTQVMSFLDAAANMDRAVTTEILQLSSPALPRSGASVLTAQATLIAYHLDEQALAAPPPTDPNAASYPASGATPNSNPAVPKSN